MFPESKLTPRFLTVSVREIEFPRNWVGNFWMRDFLACLSLMNSVFSVVEFQFYTIHPLLNTVETLSELSKSGIKVTIFKCLDIFGCRLHIDVGDIETRNDITEGRGESVKGKKKRIHNRPLGYSIGE